MVGRRRSYGDAADRRRDRANGGLYPVGVLALEFWWLLGRWGARSHLALKGTLIYWRCRDVWSTWRRSLPILTCVGRRLLGDALGIARLYYLGLAHRISMSFV